MCFGHDCGDKNCGCYTHECAWCDLKALNYRITHMPEGEEKTQKLQDLDELNKLAEKFYKEKDNG